MPLNLLAGETDHITPPDQVFALAAYASTPAADVVRRVSPGGHLGLFMGHEALSEHWPPLLESVLSHSLPAGRARRPRAPPSPPLPPPARRKRRPRGGENRRVGGSCSMWIVANRDLQAARRVRIRRRAWSYRYPGLLSPMPSRSSATGPEQPFRGPAISESQRSLAVSAAGSPGVSCWRQASGPNDRSLARSGGLTPLLHRGVYVVGHSAPIPLADETAALLALRPGAVLSHETAARVWGLLPTGDGGGAIHTRSRAATAGPSSRA